MTKTRGMSDEKGELILAIQSAIDEFMKPLSEEEAAAGWNQDTKTAWGIGMQEMKSAILANQEIFLLHGDPTQIRHVNVFRALDFSGLDATGKIGDCLADISEALRKYYED